MQNGNGAKRNGHSDPALYSSLRDLVGVVFRRRRVVYRCFAGLLGGALGAILLLPRTYEVEMKILVGRERVNPVVSTESNVLQEDRGLTQDEVVSEVELFQSRDSLEKAVIDCGLYETRDPHSIAAMKLRVLGMLGMAPDRNTRIYQAMLKLEKDLQVLPVNSSNLIKVTYDSHSPRLATEVLAELGDLYLAKHGAIHRPRGTSEFFEQQAQQYKKDLADAETRLVSFGRETGSVSPEYEKQVTMQKVSDFNVALLQAHAEIAETNQRLYALKAQEALIAPRITTLVKTSENAQLIANLKSTLLNLELRRTELLEKFEPTYPTVQEIEREISKAVAAIAEAEQKSVREETTDQDPTYQWIRTEMAKDSAGLMGLQARESAVSGALVAMKTKALQLDRESAVQQDLLRTAKADEESYLLYHRKREEARIADALDQRKIVNAAIAEAPVEALVPIGLSVVMQIVLSLIAATLLSLGLGFLAEYLDPTFCTPKDVEESLELPLLAAIPKNGH
jgi:uncharacterized protein involved in exopolysaccharide biosynthesis